MDEPKPNGKQMPIQKIRIIIEVAPEGVSIQGNVAPDVCMQILKDAIVATARQGWVKQEQSLVTPVTGALPPLRRIP